MVRSRSSSLLPYSERLRGAKAGALRLLQLTMASHAWRHPELFGARGQVAHGWSPHEDLPRASTVAGSPRDAAAARCRRCVQPRGADLPRTNRSAQLFTACWRLGIGCREELFCALLRPRPSSAAPRPAAAARRRLARSREVFKNRVVDDEDGERAHQSATAQIARADHGDAMQERLQRFVEQRDARLRSAGRRARCQFFDDLISPSTRIG